MAVRTLVSWCRDWPVIAAGRSPDEPVAVVRANRVVAASPAARHEGVTPGSRRREAQRRCPDVVVLERDASQEAREFEAVVRSLEELTPRLEVGRPGTCAFPTRGPSRYFGGDAALASRVADLVDGVLDPRGWGGHGRVGIADGPFTAHLAGHADTIVGPGASPAFLAPQPVRVLVQAGLPAELPDVLVRLGLPTLGDFAGLAPSDIVARFGAVGTVAHRLARGLDDQPSSAAVPAPDLAVAAEIDPPAERVDTAAFVAKTLAGELHSSLEARGLGCTRVLVAVETEHGEVLERFWRHEGALSAAALVERVRWQLDGWLNGPAATRPTAGITRLSLVPDEVGPAHGRQLGFWGGETEATARATRGLARVQGLLGPDAVLVPECAGGRSPDEQVVLVPLGSVDLSVPRRIETLRSEIYGSEAGLSGSSGPEAPWPGRLPTPVPARVHARARSAEVVDAEGEPVGVSGRGMAGAPPAHVAVDGGPWQPVEAWAGPWLLDERWWDPQRRRRRARYQALTPDSAVLLVLEGGRWWVEATYD